MDTLHMRLRCVSVSVNSGIGTTESKQRERVGLRRYRDIVETVDGGRSIEAIYYIADRSNVARVTGEDPGFPSSFGGFTMR